MITPVPHAVLPPLAPGAVYTLFAFVRFPRPDHQKRPTAAGIPLCTDISAMQSQQRNQTRKCKRSDPVDSFGSIRESPQQICSAFWVEEALTIEFFEAAAGTVPVQEFLLSLPAKARLKCISYIDLLAVAGLACAHLTSRNSKAISGNCGRNLAARSIASSSEGIKRDSSLSTPWRKSGRN
jgi:hypothetical protein